MTSFLSRLILLAAAAVPPSEPPVEADFVIQGATIHDGRGGPARKGDAHIVANIVAALVVQIIDPTPVWRDRCQKDIGWALGQLAQFTRGEFPRMQLKTARSIAHS